MLRERVDVGVLNLNRNVWLHASLGCATGYKGCLVLQVPSVWVSCSIKLVSHVLIHLSRLSWQRYVLLVDEGTLKSLESGLLKGFDGHRWMVNHSLIRHHLLMDLLVRCRITKLRNRLVIVVSRLREKVRLQSRIGSVRAVSALEVLLHPGNTVRG